MTIVDQRWILIVEDSVADCNAMMGVWKKEGLDVPVLRSENGDDALGAKIHEERRSIPVVVFTTSHNPKDIAFCYRLGANSFVVKPVTL